jgi:microcompartment protein CcmL/EutN
MFEPALALLEFSSIAAGIQAGDAMVKRAPVEHIRSGTVQPGHYLVLVAGDVASVGEAVQAGVETGQTALRDQLFLPNVHPDVVSALTKGFQPAQPVEALGVVETHTVAAAILAADAGLKGALVRLHQLRLADGLGGKGLAIFAGLVTDVEAAVEIGATLAANQLVRRVIIPQLHMEMWDNLNRSSRFGDHFNWPPA